MCSCLVVLILRVPDPDVVRTGLESRDYHVWKASYGGGPMATVVGMVWTARLVLWGGGRDCRRSLASPGFDCGQSQLRRRLWALLPCWRGRHVVLDTPPSVVLGETLGRVYPDRMMAVVFSLGASFWS